MSLGPHASFIIASYAAVGVVLTGLLTWLWLDGKRLQMRLQELEARGVKRRSRG